MPIRRDSLSLESPDNMDGCGGAGLATMAEASAFEDCKLDVVWDVVFWMFGLVEACGVGAGAAQAATVRQVIPIIAPRLRSEEGRWRDARNGKPRKRWCKKVKLTFTRRLTCFHATCLVSLVSGRRRWDYWSGYRR